MFFTCKHIYFSKISYISSMNWKEFLKPDWRKIVLTVIILFLVTFLPVLLGFCTHVDFQCIKLSKCVTCVLAIQPFFVFLPYTGISYTPIGLTNIYYISSSYWILNYWVLDIITWYLLSCFIVWIYDKFRKKK
jgi:hypothetical protein